MFCVVIHYKPGLGNVFPLWVFLYSAMQNLRKIFLSLFTMSTTVFNLVPWFFSLCSKSHRWHMPLGFPTPVWNPTWDPETVTVQFTLILIFIRFIVAALTTQWCYCGHALQGVRISACFNTSSNGGSREVRGEQGGQRWGFFLFSSWISLSLFWHLTPFSLSLSP